MAAAPAPRKLPTPAEFERAVQARQAVQEFGAGLVKNGSDVDEVENVAAALIAEGVDMLHEVDPRAAVVSENVSALVRAILAACESRSPREPTPER